jgi:Family of unknown function (DUF5694)
MRIMIIRSLAFATMVYSAAWPATNTHSPRDLSSLISQQRTEVFVLATPHLSQVKGNWNLAALEPLLKRLETFHPDAVAVEEMRGADYEVLLSNPGAYKGVIEELRPRSPNLAAAAQSALHLTWAQAAEQFQSRLELLTGSIHTTAQRLELVMLAIAAYEIPTAELHWRLLSLEERKQSSVPEIIRADLDESLSRRNEIDAVGVELGRRLGLTRIYGIDDQSENDLLAAAIPALEKAMSRAEFVAIMADSHFSEVDKAASREATAGNLLPAYRLYNSADYGTKDIHLQWDIFNRVPLAGDPGRTRLILWEVRNFNIAAHIARVAATHPGGHILVIIGAAHKPFLDDYLGRSMDFRIMTAAQILGTAIRP